MAGRGVWDIGLIGAEPQRAETIAFTAAYAEIEATYLVPANSPLNTIADVDAAGVRIAVTGRSAYGLWLERNIRSASLVRTETLDSAYDVFVQRRPRCACGSEAAPARGSGETARRAHSRRPIYVRSAGHWNGQVECRPAPHSCATLWKRRNPPAWSRVSSSATCPRTFRSTGGCAHIDHWKFWRILICRDQSWVMRLVLPDEGGCSNR